MMRRRATLLFAFAALLACGDDDAPPVDGGGDARVGDASAGDAGPEDAGPRPLAAVLDGPAYAVVGEAVTLDASASTGAVRFAWDLGDGRLREATPEATIEVGWEAAGRYRVVLFAEDEAGERARADRLVTVTPPLEHAPAESSTLAALPDGRVAAVSTDGATLTLIAPAPEASVARRVDTPAGPRTVSVWEREGALWLAVPCQDAAALLLVEVDGEGRHELALPAASRPFGAVSLGDALYVSLQATGEVAEVRFEGGAPRVASRLPALPDARGVARTPDGRLAVTRWRSCDDAAEIALVDVATGAVERTSLAFDPQPSNDSESGGLPSYLEQVLFSPTGREAAVPSLQANIGEGTWRSERPLSFETSVRGVVSFLGADLEEDFEARKQFDNRGFAAAGVWSSRGDYLFLATRGHRSVERLDAFTRSNAGTILGTGFAPDGLALSPDDRWLYVNASLSRRVEVYDVSSFVDLPRPVAMVPLVEVEPLAPNVLLGKQLFNDSFDPRMARDGYIACAHCHLDGDSDHRVWDFTDRGEGLRRTPPLLGRGDDGLFHWSGNFDELQDFENDIRLHFEGTGLLSGGAWAESRETFGPAKAGRSEELDALAAYMESLTHLPSPHREADGGLPPAAERGRAVFEGAGCGDCHAGANLTDSGLDGDGAPVLHDVGTLSEASGGRLGGALEGLDTPTLHGAWHQGRWLHDGAAETLGEAVRAHEGVALGDGALDDLVAYLRCLDGRVD